MNSPVFNQFYVQFIFIFQIFNLYIPSILQFIIFYYYFMYEVEKIVASRLNKNTGKNQYFVKWVGYDNNQNTWEPERNLANVRNLVTKFNMSNGKLGSKNSTEKSMSDEEDDYDKKSLGSFGQESDKTQKPSENSSHKKQEAKKSRVRNSSAVAVEQKQKKKLKITGISSQKDGGYVYKVLMDGQIKWVKRSYLVPSFLNELCQFYEQNLILKQ